MYNRAEIVFRLAPDIYNENENMLEIYNAQKLELGQYEDKIYRIFLNNYVKYADLEGIRRLEKIFNIIADEILDTIEYRRARLLNKFASLPPFTRIFLEQMFTNIFGEEMFIVNIYNDEYRVEIDIQTTIDGLFDRTMKDVRQIIPANMILEKFQIMPYTHRYIRDYYTHRQLEDLTFGELSKYA